MVKLLAALMLAAPACAANNNDCVKCHRVITQPFPDLLTFHDAPTPTEQRLFEMHLKHRMRAFQGAFHNNPDYALWYGWGELVRDLTAIRAMAEELRAEAGAQ